MQIILIATAALHVLSGVFWAGSTFMLARSGGVGAEIMARPQMGGAAVAVLAGIVLWGLTHRSGFGPPEHVLELGAASAIAAAGVQGALGLRAARRLAGADANEATALRGRVALSQRIAAGLLAVTVTCMAAARYV
jgi:hypothetical protein